jgi:hypothetical protein
MSKTAEYLRIIVDKGDEIYSLFCNVIDVDKTNNKCVVQPIRNDGTEIKLVDVQLGSKIDKENDFISYPELDSVVLVTWISTQDAFISLLGDIDEIIMKPNNDFNILNGGDFIVYCGGKIQIANQVESLKDILNDLMGAIGAITVTSISGGGVTSTPINFLQFEAIDLRINTLLK